MYHITFPDRSNRESWVFVGQIVDLDNNPIDISMCRLVFALRDRNGRLLEASTDNGKLTIVGDGMFRWFFPLEDMQGFCPGQCQTGFTIWNDDRSQVTQLSIGPLSIVDGVVRVS